MTLVLGFGTVFAHGSYRLGVHNDNPRLCTLPTDNEKPVRIITIISHSNEYCSAEKNE